MIFGPTHPLGVLVPPGLRISTILDPRFKEKGFSSKELAGDAYEVKSALEKEFKDDTEITDQHEPAPPVAKKSNSLWKDFDEEEAETFDSQKNVLGLCHQLK